MALFEEGDDQFEIMFKYYETLKMYSMDMHDLKDSVKAFNDD